MFALAIIAFFSLNKHGFFNHKNSFFSLKVSVAESDQKNYMIF